MSKAEKIRELVDASANMLARADLLVAIDAILAEPDPPASDAGAEIVAWLKAESMRLVEEGFTPGRNSEGRCWQALYSCNAAEDVLARHQTRRFVRVELTEGVERCIRVCINRPEFAVGAMTYLESVVVAAYRAQHPQPSGGA